jgi:anti-sigma-K factor RskA
MRYDAEQVEYLAAEYVLGTLHGAARRRFDRLISDRADVRFAVWRWERHLNGLVSGLRPQKPRRHVWKNIRQRINLAQSEKTASVRQWRGLWLALPAAAAAAWLAIALLPTPTADRMAVFSGQNAEALWVISTDLDDALLQIQAINVPALADDSSYELWILRDNQPPLSLGLLPVVPGSSETRISAQLVAALTISGRLAISQEPAGGSPTGLPTGPVVYQASLVTI